MKELNNLNLHEESTFSRNLIHSILVGLVSLYGGYSLGGAYIVMAASIPPTATLSINPTTVFIGQCATLTWSSTNATAASITGPGFGTSTNNNESVSLSGSKTICPTEAVNYFTLFVSGLGGYAQSRPAILNFNKTPPPLGLLKIAVIKTKASGSPDPNVTKAGIDETLSEIRKYIQENSYNQVGLAWDIYDTTYESIGVVGEGLAPNYWVAADPFVDFRNYTTVLSIDERNPAEQCRGAGACAGDKTNITFTNDNPLSIASIFTGSFFVQSIPTSHRSWARGSAHSTMVHEFGHSLGLLGHSWSYNCGTQLIDNPENCVKASLELFDIMGTMTLKGHFSVLNKEIIGWATENNGKIKKITQSGIYRLYSLEKNINPVGLKIPRRMKTENCSTMELEKDYYYLEFRTKNGYDQYVINQASYNGPIGPQVRFLNYDSSRVSGYDGTLNVDMPPSDVIRDNNAITISNPFIDPMRGIKLSLGKMGSNYVDVVVDLGDKVCN